MPSITQVAVTPPLQGRFACGTAQTNGLRLRMATRTEAVSSLNAAWRELHPTQLHQKRNDGRVAATVRTPLQAEMAG